MNSVQKSKSNFLLAMSLFGVFAVGGVAIMLSNNNAVNLKTGASNVDENLSDVLVKRGTSAFSPCKGLDAKYTYALLGNGIKAVKGTPSPKGTGKPEAKPSVKPSPNTMPNSCTPLVATSALADKYVGKRVSVTGTYKDGVFYATAVADANFPNVNSEVKGDRTQKAVKTARPVLPNTKDNPLIPLDPQD